MRVINITFDILLLVQFSPGNEKSLQNETDDHG